ncbi:hypothetical protein ACIP6P_30475 [Streptomyces sp. NPDC088729]|uniref:hypothetical protein n=1 Tax=Streptomyces sp. NPDC088729 TaxID=3365876 RepID=UPI00382C30D1
MASHARKNAARRKQDLSGLNRRAALQEIRNTLPPAQHARRAARLSDAAEAPDAVPAELVAVVQDFTRWGRRHLDDAVRVAQQYGDHPGDWHRLVLYALTDALAYNVLLVGALAGYLQEQGLDEDLLRRHLQTPDPDRYVTQDALDLLAGLMGRPVNDGQREATWQFVGRQIAECAVPRGAEAIS